MTARASYKARLAIAFALFTFSIAACLVVTLLLGQKRGPNESADAKLRSLPLYPGATQITWADTDTPGSGLTHQMTFCQIECAYVNYEVQASAEEVIRYYEGWAAKADWRPWTITNEAARTYVYGPVEFQRWVFPPEFPWIRARSELRRHYILDMRTSSGSQQGAAHVELLLGRMEPMASDTPLPTLPPPPPTAVIHGVPGNGPPPIPSIPVPMPTTR